MTAPALVGVPAIRLITAEVLADLEDLGITPRSLTVDLYRDGTPSEVAVWFLDYDDAWAYQQRVGLPPVTRFNGDSDSTLLSIGGAAWWPGAPTVAGVRLGMRLICNRPGADQ